MIYTVQIPLDFTVNTGNWLPGLYRNFLQGPVEVLQELPHKMG